MRSELLETLSSYALLGWLFAWLGGAAFIVIRGGVANAADTAAGWLGAFADAVREFWFRLRAERKVSAEWAAMRQIADEGRTKKWSEDQQPEPAPAPTAAATSESAAKGSTSEANPPQN